MSTLGRFAPITVSSQRDRQLTKSGMGKIVDALSDCKYLFMTEIGEPIDNELRIRVIEAKSGDPVDSSILHDESLKGILKSASGISHHSGCKIFELIWPSYIAYSVRNESFVSSDAYEEFEGKLLVTYKKSRYLDFVASATFAKPDYPGPFKHLGIFCLNHIVDVVSMDDPKISVSVSV